MSAAFKEGHLKPLAVRAASWCVRLCALSALIFIILTGLFIAGFTMADNQSAWPHIQLILFVIALVVAISFAEGRIERLIRNWGEPKHPQS